MKKALICALVCALCGAAVAQGKSKINTEYKYLLLATVKTSTMQKEIDEASALGYRAIVGSPTSGSEMVLLMERQPESTQRYHYKLLATTRTSTMEKELNDAAREGYRLMPSTIISKKGMMSEEIVCVLERAPTDDRYQYKLLATSLTSTMQKEITEAMAAGYEVAGMVSRGEHMVIMERKAKTASD
jgi:hypothetical protein